MSIRSTLAGWFGLQASTPGPAEDFWYQPVGMLTQSGLRVDAEGARKISAWFRGRDLLATSLAMLPLPVLERLSNDQGSNVAHNHPLYDVLHRKPNPAQDAFGWKRQQMYHLIDYGNAYDWIDIEGRWSLEPIHPTLVTPEKITSGKFKGRKLFHVRDEKRGTTSTYNQDEIFHRVGASDDGIVGKGILEYARDSLGTALATESYASRIFSNGTLSGGTIENPGLLDAEAARRMAKTFVTRVGEWHMPKVLEQGSKFTPNALTPEDAQMLLSRKFSIDDIARWLGVPPHMIGSLDRSTNNNIEHQGQEFVTYSLGPWLSLWEFAINDQLILVPRKYYAQFTRQALVRGDIAARWAAYQIAVSTGTFTRNEVRRIEDMNALPGLDEPLDPAFLAGKQEPKPKDGAEPEPDEDEDEEEPAKPEKKPKAVAIAEASAARLLRKEVAAVSRLAVKHAADQDAFAADVTEFYAKHADLVALTLMMGMDEARAYCSQQAAQVLTGDWVAAVELWNQDAYAGGLAGLAIEGEAA